MKDETRSCLKHLVKQEKILLAVTPFWDPLIPPQGIASLKGFLQKHGFQVKAVDTNVESQFMDMYNKYFKILRKYVPEKQWGNFYSIGHFVLQNQLMAHFNHDNNEEEKYIELIKILVYKTFYIQFDDSRALELKDTLKELYSRLENFFTGLVEKEEPGVLGLTLNTGTFPASLFVFKTIKEKYPHIKTVAGGNIFADQLALGSPNYEYFLERTATYIDKVILGQGELLLLEYLRGQLPASKRVYTKAVINGKTLGFSDLDTPVLDDYNIAAYPYMAAAGSASCKYQCSFCNSAKYWGEYRMKNPVQTVREMIALYSKYKSQLFFMLDSMLNPIIDEFSHEIIKAGVPLYWDGYFRVDENCGYVENTLYWRQAGFYRARIGVESGSQHILDLIGKDITIAQTKAAIMSLAYAGIKTTTYWVIGHPGETEEDFQQTLALLDELKNDIWQAECAQFDYYYDGQSKSQEWADKRILLYPPWAKKMLISQGYILDCPPSREETYERLFRFVRHCKKVGVPNPYSLPEIHKADERWKKLHKNAVPAMLDFKNKKAIVDERSKAKKLLTTRSQWTDEGDFGF